MPHHLDGIYDFMRQAYEGNWQYRWEGTPYFAKTLALGRHESILAHQWSCVALWFQLKYSCPELAGCVNTEEVYERLWFHDLGETFTGDISSCRQLQGGYEDKAVIEKQEVEKICADLPAQVREKMLRWFDEFEQPVAAITKPEPLLAKFIDNLQGNHFVLVYGHDLASYSDLIDAIISRKTIPVAQRLMACLPNPAAAEVHEVLQHMLKMYEDRGVVFGRGDAGSKTTSVFS